MFILGGAGLRGTRSVLRGRERAIDSSSERQEDGDSAKGARNAGAARALRPGEIDSMP
jgi:hypothetical protein